MTLCIVACSTLASRVVTRVGPKPMLVAGMTLQAVGLALLTQISPDGGYLSDVLVPSLLIAIGIGFSFVPVTLAGVAGVASEEAGLASGLVNTSRFVGGALGLAILAALATARTAGDVHAGLAAHAALTGGFELAFGIAAAFSAVGAVVALIGLPRVSLQGLRRGAIAAESA
jgi:MFS family permease